MPDWLSHIYAISGIIISAVGAWLTIIAARQAKRAANDAKTSADLAASASNEARARMRSIDWVLHFGSMASTISALLDRLDEKADWVRVSSECTGLRSGAAIAVQSPAVRDDDLLKKIKLSPRGFATVSSIADQKIADRTSIVDIVKVRKILSDQHGIFSLALQNARDHAAKDAVND